MAEVGFYHGALANSYEKQANQQGYTLGDKAELFEKLGFSCNMLWIWGLLTPSQADRIRTKITLEMGSYLRPLETMADTGEGPD